MSTESEIKTAIQGVVGSNYSSWYIGITANPKQRREQHEADGKDTKYWREWKADSETAARNIEAYFLEKGMKGGEGGGDKPTYVYIY
jgi:predicted GIY-YIG superfamily endonuclease